MELTSYYLSWWGALSKSRCLVGIPRQSSDSTKMWVQKLGWPKIFSQTGFFGSIHTLAVLKDENCYYYLTMHLYTEIQPFTSALNYLYSLFTKVGNITATTAWFGHYSLCQKRYMQKVTTTALDFIDNSRATQLYDVDLKTSITWVNDIWSTITCLIIYGYWVKSGLV